MKVFKKQKNKQIEQTKKLKKQADELVSVVEDTLDIENESARKVGEQTFKETQDFIIENSEAETIEELSEEERQKAAALFKRTVMSLLQNENISNEAAGDFIVSLIENYSKTLGVKIAIDMPNLPDNSIKKIINRPEVGIKEAETLVEGIEDEETKQKIQEDLNIQKLKRIYNTCDEKGDLEVKKEVQRELLTIDERTDKINKAINEIIAKKVATNIKNYGSNMIGHFTDIIKPLEMLEEDFPDLVEEEFEKTEGVKGNLKYSYKKEEFKKSIIQKLGKDIATQYLEQPKGTRTVVIPKSDKISEFSEDEMEELVSSINITTGSKLKKHELQNIKNQIRGLADTEEVLNLKNNLVSIRNIENREYLAEKFNSILETLKELPEEKQKYAMDIFENEAQNYVKNLNTKKEKEPEKDNKEISQEDIEQ